jgi:formylmethanofuran dehydrogenase subunit B
MQKSQSKKSNAGSGTKAHNDNKFLKVGRIRYNSWATTVLKACDIVVSERELVHIYKDHASELEQLGISVFNFVKFIVDNFNAIYQGSENSYLLVVQESEKSKQAAIILTTFGKKNQYQIKTATPIETKRLSKKKLLSSNLRKVGS